MDLRAEILSRSDCAAAVAARDTTAIAAVLSVGRTKVISKSGGIGMVLGALGPVNGAALLDTLETASTTNPPLKWAFVLINRGDLDFGSPATRAMIDQLIPGPAGVALKAVAEVPDAVTEFEVRQALWADDGTWMGI